MNRPGGLDVLTAAALLALAVGCHGPPVASPRDGGNQAGGTGGGGTGGASLGQPCATAVSAARPTHRPDALILLDASGSMNETLDGTACDGGCGAGSRWAEASALVNGLVTATETSVNWGLMLFPSGGGICTAAGGLRVPVGAGSTSAIATAIGTRTDANGGLTSTGNTPTRLAEQAAASTLAMLGGEGRKVILLVTHGAPNCGTAGNAADDSPAAVEAISGALASGIPTIVVGITPAGGPADATLASMATAGGHARAGASPAYYPPSAIGDLTATIEALGAAPVDCVYRLPEAPTSDPVERPIGVQVDGVDLPRDRSHVSGWDYTDPSLTAVQIFGPVCREIQDGQHQTVTIGFYCRGTL
jgi:hypothetical protein